LTSKQKPVFSALDPCKYLDFAKEIASRPETQARRTAADRAYYAAFLFSRDQLEMKGYMTRYGYAEDHRYVTQKLRELLGFLGNEEFRMRTHRNNVTYETGDVGPPPLAWMLDTAEKIIESVKKLPASFPGK